MKKMTMLIALLVLAGCAGGSAGLRETDLRDREFFRTERTIPLTFPKIQMALFKHKDACGSAPRFSMDKYQTGYGSIIDKPEGTEDFEQAVLVDIVQYQATMMDEPRTKAKVYSYYANAATDAQIDRLFNAILHPEVCPPK